VIWLMDGFTLLTSGFTQLPPAVSLFYAQVDHLNTPRLVANSTGTTVWRWDQREPFGVNVPDENPSGLGAFEFPLRFPGQYVDKETNLHYNYLRDFDPGIGRYVQSDPIGLQGGLNTYAYVSASPVKFIDPAGLLRCRWVGLVLHCEWGPPSAGGASDWPRDTSKGSSSSSESNSGAKEKECPPDEDCNAEYTNCLVSGWGGKVGFDSACYACYEKCRGSSPRKWPDRVWTGTWNLYVSCEYWLTRIPK